MDPPNAACTSIAFSMALSVRTVPSVRPACHWSWTASAVRRATSSQIGCPEGASAAWGTVSPRPFGHHLRGGGCTEELAATAGRRAGATAEVGCLVERDELVRETCSERLDGARILAASRRQRHPAGDHCTGELAERSDRHHHRRQSLVTRSDADHSLAIRQAPHEPAQHERRVVAVGQRVEHPGRPLRAAVAGVGDVGGEREACRVGRAPPRPRARAARPPSDPCGTRVRRACRRRRERRRASRGSGTGRDRPWTPPTPCRRSATARTRRRTGAPVRNESVSGRAPSGPAAVVSTSKRSRSSIDRDPGRSVVAAVLANGLAHDLDQTRLGIEDLAGRAEDVSASRHRRVEATPHLRLDGLRILPRTGDAR